MSLANRVDPALVTDGTNFQIRLGISDPNLTQAKYNAMYKYPEMSFPGVYAGCLKTFICGVIYLPIFPMGLLITAVALGLTYLADKRNLVSLTSRSYTQSELLSEKALNFVYVAAAVLSMSFWFLLSPSLHGSTDKFVEDA